MKTLIVVDLALSHKLGTLSQANLEEFTDNLAELIDVHGLRSDLDISAFVHLATFDENGNEVSSSVPNEIE